MRGKHEAQSAPTVLQKTESTKNESGHLVAKVPSSFIGEKNAESPEQYGRWADVKQE